MEYKSNGYCYPLKLGFTLAFSILLSLIIPNLTHAKLEDNVVISALVNKTKIPLDKELKFTVTLSWNKKLLDITPDTPEPPTFENFINAGNFFSSDTKSTIDGQITSNHYGFILKPERVGNGSIGPVSITYMNNETGEEKTLTTSSIEVTITKPLADKLYLLKVFIKYFAIILVLALIIIVVIKVINKKREERERIKDLNSRPTVEEKYIKKLQALYSTRQIIGDKEYCSKISQILRKFIENKFELKLTGSTTDKILSTLTSIDLLKQDSVDLLISIFDFCDNVKYAGSEPNKDNVDNLQFKAESFISSMQDLINSEDRGNQNE